MRYQAYIKREEKEHQQSEKKKRAFQQEVIAPSDKKLKNWSIQSKGCCRKLISLLENQTIKMRSPILVHQIQWGTKLQQKKISD